MYYAQGIKKVKECYLFVADLQKYDEVVWLTIFAGFYDYF